MDLDLLTYGDLVQHDGNLDIPRDEITQYAYVLKPLADIAPYELHPETGVAYRDIWETGEFSGQDLHEVTIS